MTDTGTLGITVWVPEGARNERDGLPSFRAGKEQVLRSVKVDPATISRSLHDILAALAPVIESAPTGKGLVVDELELALTISAEGEVGIIASVSAGVEASIKLKLKRPAG
jgi:hypothetical protein